MRRYSKIMDSIQEPLEWMTIGFFIATVILVTVVYL